MESDKSENEDELTSTMGNLLSTNKDEKSETCDSTPTSSTDAFATPAVPPIASDHRSDDPISSTSSDVLDPKTQAAPNTSIGPVKEMLDMNITDTSTEKNRTENVDDIVQDLENLLGEPSASFDFIVKAKKNKSTHEQEDKDLSREMEQFAMELNITEDKPLKDVSAKVESKENNGGVNTPQEAPQRDAVLEKQTIEASKPQESQNIVELTEQSQAEPIPDSSQTDSLPKYDISTEKADHDENAVISSCIEENTKFADIPEPKSEKYESPQSDCSEIKEIVKDDVQEKETAESVYVKEDSAAEETEQSIPVEDSEPNVIFNEKDAEMENIETSAVAKESQDVAVVSNKNEFKETEIQSDEIVEVKDANVDIELKENEVLMVHVSEDIKRTEIDKECMAIIAKDECKETHVFVDIPDIEKESIVEKNNVNIDDQTVDTISSNTECLLNKREQVEVENTIDNVDPVEANKSDGIPEITEPDDNEKNEFNECVPKDNVEPTEATKIVDEVMALPNLKSYNKESKIVEPHEKVIDEQCNIEKDEEILQSAMIESIQDDIMEVSDTKLNNEEFKEKVEPVEELAVEAVEMDINSDIISDPEKIEEPTAPLIEVGNDNQSLNIIEQQEPTSNQSENEIKKLDSRPDSSIAASLHVEEPPKSIPPETQIDDSLIIHPDPQKTPESLESESEAKAISIDLVTKPETDKGKDLDNPQMIRADSSIPFEQTQSVDEEEDVESEAETVNGPLEDIAESIEAIDEVAEKSENSSESTNPLEIISSSSVDIVIATKTPQDIEVLNAISSIGGDDERYYIAQEEECSNASNSNEISQPMLDDSETMLAVTNIQESIDLNQPKSLEAPVSQSKDKLKEPLEIRIDDVVEKERVYSPKITIKPIKPIEDVEVVSMSGEDKETPRSLKMTITKQSNTMHSILKIYDPEGGGSDSPNQEEPETQTVPKLIIKSLIQPSEQQHSPKSKKVFSPSSNAPRSSSPRVTIKPIVKPISESMVGTISPLKITIKPLKQHDDSHRQKHSPKLTIKPIIKPDDEENDRVHSPRVTIKPIVKPDEDVSDRVHSPRVTIKPIKPPEEQPEMVLSPRITIKPIVKPVDGEPTTPRVTIKPVIKPDDNNEPVEKASPKITIKPIVKPDEERIVLKINKGNLPTSSSKEEKSEKLAKIKLKFSKEGGHAHIVQESVQKRSPSPLDHPYKRQKTEHDAARMSPSHSKLKEMLSVGKGHVISLDDDDDDDDSVENVTMGSSPIVISDNSSQDVVTVVEVTDPLSDIPVFEITPESVKTLGAAVVAEVPATPLAPTPRKRGRPRKVPLEVREDFKEEPKTVFESTRPKRSCRGQNVRATLGIKPRKPRGGGRGRGSKRGMGTRVVASTPPPSPSKALKEPKLSTPKRLVREDLLSLASKSEDQISYDGFLKSPGLSALAPPIIESATTATTADRADIVMYEEETRMSSETSSRAQTPAKQVISTPLASDIIDESQSSVHSTATTESAKGRRGARLEVHQEPEGAVVSADQLAEYYWSGGGPYMLQEQVAQFLGIKSFKRKYPNIPRRVVDMQERDFIRESGLAGEAMCDLGLTAVNSTDILDIMYSDFQDKYEEYCKHQRDRQAKDLTNKQRALSLAASQEKNKIDITQQAVQSAANWNTTFNKTRREQRKASMDLQTLTIHFPKGKVKQINKPKIGNYPVALVPGQFTDYFKEFTPSELNNLPLGTLCYDNVAQNRPVEMECDSQTDGSGSESDSSSSDSDSSFSGSSDGEDCTLCKPSMKRIAAQ